MEKQMLDYIMVPTGMVIMGLYHLWLLYKIKKHPTSTVVGLNAINRRFWVQAMMEDVPKNGVLAVQTLRNNIMASTLLASTAIMLSSLIAVLMTNGGGGCEQRSSSSSTTDFVYGDRSELGLSVKFFSILVCFLVAFMLNVQSIRYYSHASILINVPFNKVLIMISPVLGTVLGGSKSKSRSRSSHDLAVEFVSRTVNRGSYFWSLGLRAFYFSFPLFLWIFGPIPMFICCLALVFMLYFLDVTFDVGWVVAAAAADAGDHKEEDNTTTV